MRLLLVFILTISRKSGRILDKPVFYMIQRLRKEEVVIFTPIQKVAG